MFRALIRKLRHRRVFKPLTAVAVFTVLYVVHHIFSEGESRSHIENKGKLIKQLFHTFKEEEVKTTTVAPTEASLYTDTNTTDVKTILWYLPQNGNDAEESMLHCGQNQVECFLSSDLSILDSADAVIVDGYMLSQSEDRIQPKRKTEDQIWIFYSKEPWSSYGSDFPSDWNSIFNWTFTYRRDSDFMVPGSEVVRYGANIWTDWDQILQSKTRDVLWIVNDCKSDSKREEYVNEMREYIDIDIMGDCGNPICTDDDVHGSCYENYYFYLSFESTHCKDYITDSFYKTFRHPIVPIVRGGANYKMLYPGRMYLNTADFASAKHLAQHLNYLIRKDKKAYVDYLKQKELYQVMERQDNKCLLCNRLHQAHLYGRSYPHIAGWMDTCSKPSDLHG